MADKEASRIEGVVAPASGRKAWATPVVILSEAKNSKAIAGHPLAEGPPTSNSYS